MQFYFLHYCTCKNQEFFTNRIQKHCARKYLWKSYTIHILDTYYCMHFTLILFVDYIILNCFLYSVFTSSLIVSFMLWKLLYFNTKVYDGLPRAAVVCTDVQNTQLLFLFQLTTLYVSVNNGCKRRSKVNSRTECTWNMCKYCHDLVRHNKEHIFTDLWEHNWLL